MADHVALIDALGTLLKALGSWPTVALVAVIAAAICFAPLAALVHIWRRDTATIRGLVEDHRRETADIMSAYRVDTARILGQHGDAIKDFRQSYDNNVELVHERARDFNLLRQLVDDQQGLTVSMVRIMTALEQSIRTNQYCPESRVEKKQVEVKA
jgi:hypothetical protein